MKITPAEIERRISQAIHAWESSCPEQPFAEVTLEQFKQALQRFHDSKAKFLAANAQWETSRQEHNAAYVKATELLKLVVSSVKGHPKYGENSAVYAAMGYVPKSERSSGLTRRREAESAKERAEVS